MTLETLLALIGFALVTSITPGPSNLLLLASGLNFGFRASFPAALGVSVGFLTVLLLVGAGLGRVLELNAAVSLAFRWGCAGYVLWLAWKVARSSPKADQDNESIRPPSFWEACLLQWINPKAWTVAVIATATYVWDPSFLGLFQLAGIFGLVNLPSLCVWAAFGVFFRRLLSDAPKVRLLNGLMALLLAASLFPVLFDLF